MWKTIKKHGLPYPKTPVYLLQIGNNNCFIAFDDFLVRPQYWVVLDFYDIIEKTQDDQMVILRKKNNVVIPTELIKKYELDED